MLDEITKMLCEYNDRFKGEKGTFDYVINGQRFNKSDVEIGKDCIILTTDILDDNGDKILDIRTGGYKRNRSWLTLNPESKATVNIDISSFTIKSHEIS